MCETLWRPKMTPDELFECISQAMMSALDRDASSGKLNFSENKLRMPEPYILARQKHESGY
jgi:20S proteasome alpha/beta subunit